MVNIQEKDIINKEDSKIIYKNQKKLNKIINSFVSKIQVYVWERIKKLNKDLSYEHDKLHKYMIKQKKNKIEELEQKTMLMAYGYKHPLASLEMTCHWHCGVKQLEFLIENNEDLIFKLSELINKIDVEFLSYQAKLKRFEKLKKFMDDNDVPFYKGSWKFLKNYLNNIFDEFKVFDLDDYDDEYY